MKKMAVTIILLAFFLKCTAPTFSVITIFRFNPIYGYGIKDPLTLAVADYESDFIPNIVNPISGARGLMQILPVMVNEVNRICRLKGIPERYTWNDAFDPVKSVKMWYIVQDFWNPEYDIDQACMIWFGRGVQKHDGHTWREYSVEVRKRMKHSEV